MQLRSLLRSRFFLITFFAHFSVFAIYFFVFKTGFLHCSFDYFVDLSGNIGLKVSDIVVKNNDIISYNDIISVIKSKVGKPLIAVDINKIRNDLMSEITWIDSVSVRKEFPDQIIIDVKEHLPVAVFSDRQNSFLIDIFGKEIVDFKQCKKSYLKERFSELIELEGEGAKENIRNLLPVIKVNQLVFQDIIAAKRIGNRRWDIIFKNGLEVMLPSSDEKESWKYVVEAIRRDKSIPLKVKKIDCRVKGRIYFVN